MFTKRLFNLVIAITLLAIVSLTIREAIATSAVTLTEQVQEAQHMQRSRDADVARWKAMGEYYIARQAEEAQRMQRSRDGDAARWKAMGGYYTARQAEEAQRMQRSRDADAARWKAMGEYYAARQETNK